MASGAAFDFAHGEIGEVPGEDEIDGGAFAGFKFECANQNSARFVRMFARNRFGVIRQRFLDLGGVVARWTGPSDIRRGAQQREAHRSVVAQLS